MNTTEAITVLIELLDIEETKQIPLRRLVPKLQTHLDTSTDASTIIEYALDNWIVDKILDYDDSSEESIGRPVWFIRLLSEKDTETLRNLSDANKAFLKMLRNSNEEENRGAIRADDVLRALREEGYEIEFTPNIPSKTDECYRFDNDESTLFCYLIPEDEKTEEYLAGLRELDEKNRRRLGRMGY